MNRKKLKWAPVPEEPPEKDPLATKGMPDLFPQTPVYYGKLLGKNVVVVRIKESNPFLEARVHLFLDELQQVGVLDQVVIKMNDSTLLI